MAGLPPAPISAGPLCWAWGRVLQSTENRFCFGPAGVVHTSWYVPSGSRYFALRAEPLTSGSVLWSVSPGAWSGAGR